MGRFTMGKLSKLFMEYFPYSRLPFPPSRKAKRGRRSQLGCHLRRIFHGIRVRHLRPGAGQGDGRCS